MDTQELKHVMRCRKCGEAILLDENPLLEKEQGIKNDYAIVKLEMAKYSEVDKLLAPEKWQRLVGLAINYERALSEIKRIKRQTHDSWNNEWLMVFKEVIKSQLGDELYKTLIDETNKRLLLQKNKMLEEQEDGDTSGE